MWDANNWLECLSERRLALGGEVEACVDGTGNGGLRGGVWGAGGALLVKPRGTVVREPSGLVDRVCYPSGEISRFLGGASGCLLL